VTSRFLLDTNVVSEIRRSRPDPAVTAWFDGLGQAELFLSVLTLGEIGLGIHRLRRRDAEQADVLDRWLAELRRVYADRVLPVTDEVAERWAMLNTPRPLPVVDGLLAATALVHDAVLVTRNTADLRGVDVRTIDPFTR